MQSDFLKRNFRTLLIVGVLCVACTTLWAADITARIRGTVTDPSGAVVANGNITAINIETGLEYKTTSTSSGDYEVVKLPVGTYRMTVQAAGFRTFAVSGIKLSVDQVYVQPIKLQVGQASETIEVKASAVQVDTTNIQLGAVITSTQILDLPLIGRNFTQLQLLLPGVQGGSDRFGSNQAGGAFSTNGAQSQQNSFLVNGNDTNDLPLNVPLYVPSVDAISEFNFATSSLNPEYGRNGGAVLSATIKNGTNNFHGSAFEFYRDSFLNLANYFQKNCNLPRCNAPVFHQNTYGGTLGGPIWKNKAFFFVSYQGIRARAPQPNQSVVLSPAERTGDFSANASLLTATNPIPGTIGAVLGGFNAACIGGNTWGQCFTATGGLIPGGTAGMNPISLALMNQFIPLPNGPGNGFSFGAVATQPRTHQLITREDFTLSSKDQLWGVFTYAHTPATQDLPFTGASVPGFGSRQGTDVRQVTVDWTHTFSPTTLNEFRVGYTRLNLQTVFPQTPVLPSSVGFAINPQLPAEAGLPVIAVAGGGLAATSGAGTGFTLGFSNNGPQPRIDETRQIGDNFTKIMGKHSFKFGWNGSKFNVNNPFAFENGGTYTFSGDASGTAFSTGNGFLDFLLGNPDLYGQSTNAVINATAWESYAYAQDVWKATPNLTVTLGVGWQVDTPLYQHQFKQQGIVCFIGGQRSTVYPNNGLPYSNPAATGPPIGINYPGDKGCDTAGGAKIGWHNLGPRVGFAYSPDLGRISGGKSNKFVIRGGIGIYYNRSEEEAALQDLGDAPYGLTSAGAGDFGAAAPAFANPYQDIDTGTVFTNKYPATFSKPGQVVNYHTFTPLFMSHFSPDFKIPYAINYNLTVQRELPANTVLTLSYVGSQGRHLQTVVEQNPVTRAGHDDCLINNPVSASVLAVTCKSATGRSLHEFLFPTHTQFGAGGLLTDPNGFTAVTSAGTVASRGKSSYNSLQVGVTKGYSHGLLFQASYTYSHSLDDASSFEASGFGGANRGYNDIFPALNKGNSAFDARHRFVFSPVYTFPQWKALPAVISKGWKITGIFTAASGFTFDMRDSAGRSLWCASRFYVCPDAPRLIGTYTQLDPRVDNTAICGSRSCWFNPNAFGRETIGSFDGVSRNKFHGPGINNIDFALEKDIFFQPSHEKRFLQLRIEFFNALNHTQFALPSGRVNLGTAGQISAAAPGRAIQLGAKLYF
jgi:hypothetical protein